MADELADGEEDDYMSDAILNSCGEVRPGLYKGKKEAYKRCQEKKSEEGRNNRPKPTKVLEAEKREEGLSKSLDSSNKGFALLQKMGYKPGVGIGKSGQGRMEPVGIELKANRGGLGQEAETRKRAKQLELFREQQYIKRVKMAQEMQNNYRDTKISEQRRRRVEKYVRDSQMVCEQLDNSQDIDEPLRFYYWPVHLRPSNIKEKNSVADECDEEDDKQEVEEEEEEEPEVLDQLEEITEYLRSTHLYCIWCGYAFDDAETLSRDCPGNTAEDHDEL